MWLSHTREESSDTRQEGGGAGPSPRGGLCKGQRACPRVQAGEPDAAGPRPRRPAERTRPRKDHAESRTVRQWTASGTRQDSTGDRTSTGLVTSTERASPRDSDPVVHRSQADGTRGHTEDDDRLARFATAGYLSATPGTYRMRHVGAWKNGTNRVISPYQG